MADTVAVMNHGRIEQLGSPADLYELPRTAFVANFLGQSNLVAGTVTERLTKRGLLGVDVRGTRVLVPAARAVRTRRRGARRVRPEKMRLLVGDQVPGRSENVLGPGTVTDVSFMGVSTQYQVEVAGPRDVRRLRAEPAGRCHGRGRRRPSGWPGRSTSRSGWTARRPATTARSTWTTSCERIAAALGDSVAGAAAEPPAPPRSTRPPVPPRTRPGLPGPVLRRAGRRAAGDVAVRAGPRRGRGGVPAGVPLAELRRLARPVLAGPAALLLVRVPGHRRRAGHRLPDGVRHRGARPGPQAPPGAAAGRWSSRRSSPASSCAPSRGSRSSPTTPSS